MADNLVYDNHMNLVPDVQDVDHVSGMNYVDQSRPISVMKSETVPNDFKDTLVDPRVFDVKGGEEIPPHTNPMMVDTRIPSDSATSEGSNNQYHRMEPDLVTGEVTPVVEVLDTVDQAALESLVAQFDKALESAGYAVDFRGETDPNAPVDLTRLLDEVEYSDGLSLRSSQRIDTVTDLRNEIIELGGITKDQAYAIESLRPNFLTARVSLETFTRFPSRTNMEVAMVALEDLVAAASVAGLTITVLAITKLIQWIIKKIQSFRYDSKSDSVRTTYLRAYDAQLKAIRDTSNKFANVLSQSQPFYNIVNKYCSDLGVGWSYTDAPRIAVELNDALYQDLTAGKWSPFVESMYNGEAVKLSTYLVAACNNSLITMDAKFQKLKAVADSKQIVPPDQFVNKWDEVAKLSEYLLGGVPGAPDQVIGQISDAIRQRLSAPADSKSPLRFETAMRTLRYSLDNCFRFDKRNASRVQNMFNTIRRIEGDLKKIDDPAVRQNRVALYEIFKKELQMLAILLNALGACDAAAIAYISSTNQVVKRNGRMWVDAFDAANVHFAYKQ